MLFSATFYNNIEFSKLLAGMVLKLQCSVGTPCRGSIALVASYVAFDRQQFQTVAAMTTQNYIACDWEMSSWQHQNNTGNTHLTLVQIISKCQIAVSQHWDCILQHFCSQIKVAYTFERFWFIAPALLRLWVQAILSMSLKMAVSSSTM